MNTLILIFVVACGLWMLATVFAAFALASRADKRIEHLRRKENRRRHTLAKLMNVNGGIK